MARAPAPVKPAAQQDLPRSAGPCRPLAQGTGRVPRCSPSDTRGGRFMRALAWHGKEDIRCESVPDPRIEHPRDAIIRVTSCAICGSDLHLYDNMMPGMKSGDVMGHETMGEVMEVGPEAKGALKVGDRVVIPFTITCGECWQCRRGNFSLCETTNRNAAMQEKVYGRRAAGLFGY